MRRALESLVLGFIFGVTATLLVVTICIGDAAFNRQVPLVVQEAPPMLILAWIVYTWRRDR